MKKIRLILVAAAMMAAGTGMQAQQRLVSHRGGRFEAEENTLEAFTYALQDGLRGFELDIHITADGEYVIMHDYDISRMTGAEGTIEQMTAKELAAVRTKQGHKIPTLDEVLALFNSVPGVYAEFELKTQREDLYSGALLEKYLEHVYKAVYAGKPAESDYILSSFDTRALKYLSEKHPDAELMLITAEGCNDKTIAVARALGLHRIACNVNETTAKAVKTAHGKGFKVNLWPGPAAADVRLAKALGADYICTDIPHQIKAIIDKEGLDIQP